MLLYAIQLIQNVYQSMLKTDFNSSNALAHTSALTNTSVSSVKNTVPKRIKPGKERRDSGSLRSVKRMTLIYLEEQFMKSMKNNLCNC